MQFTLPKQGRAGRGLGVLCDVTLMRPCISHAFFFFQRSDQPYFSYCPYNLQRCHFV